MINNVVLVGRLTKDPELRSTASGASVIDFNLAVNRSYQSSDGQDADFIKCTAWNKTAENMEKYLSKGSLIGVEGRIQTRSYENNQGQTVYVTEVYCNRVQFLESRRSNESQSTTQSSSQPAYQQSQGYSQQYSQRDNYNAFYDINSDDGIFEDLDDLDDSDIEF